MTRGRAPKHLRDRRQQLRTASNLPHNREDIRRWWKLPLQGLGILSIIAGLLTLIPRIQLEVTGSLDSSAPMRTVFSISNDGLLPIHDITATCYVDSLTNTFGMGMDNIGVRFPESKAAMLSPSQKMALPCNRVVNITNTATAKMTISLAIDPIGHGGIAISRFPSWRTRPPMVRGYGSGFQNESVNG
jgi:hypothetical protein